MKIIDLLNKIANDEEIPKKIKTCDNDIFYYDETDDNEVARYKNKNDILITDEFYLNDKVEIIEEDKEIERLEPVDLEPLETSEDQQDYEISTMWNKINEIIDYLMENNK